MPLLPENPESYNFQTIMDLGDSALTLLTELAGLIVAIAFIWGAIQYIQGTTTGDKENKTAKGKTIIMGAVTGIVIILLARVIISQVLTVLQPNPDQKNIPSDLIKLFPATVAIKGKPNATTKLQIKGKGPTVKKGTNNGTKKGTWLHIPSVLAKENPPKTLALTTLENNSTGPQTTGVNPKPTVDGVACDPFEADISANDILSLQSGCDYYLYYGDRSTFFSMTSEAAVLAIFLDSFSAQLISATPTPGKVTIITIDDVLSNFTGANEPYPDLKIFVRDVDNSATPTTTPYLKGKTNPYGISKFTIDKPGQKLLQVARDQGGKFTYLCNNNLNLTAGAVYVLYVPYSIPADTVRTESCPVKDLNNLTAANGSSTTSQ